jgi:hypothetical protein
MNVGDKVYVLTTLGVFEAEVTGLPVLPEEIMLDVADRQIPYLRADQTMSSKHYDVFPSGDIFTTEKDADKAWFLRELAGTIHELRWTVNQKHHMFIKLLEREYEDITGDGMWVRK